MPTLRSEACAPSAVVGGLLEGVDVVELGVGPGSRSRSGHRAAQRPRSRPARRAVREVVSPKLCALSAAALTMLMTWGDPDATKPPITLPSSACGPPWERRVDLGAQASTPDAEFSDPACGLCGGLRVLLAAGFMALRSCAPPRSPGALLSSEALITALSSDTGHLAGVAIIHRRRAASDRSAHTTVCTRPSCVTCTQSVGTHRCSNCIAHAARDRPAPTSASRWSRRGRPVHPPGSGLGDRAWRRLVARRKSGPALHCGLVLG